MGRQLGRISVLAAGIGALLGPNVFFVPKRVETLAGPVTPLSYLFATAAALAVAVGFAVVASSPLGSRPGGAYLTLSRTWGSRTVGFLVGWIALGAYVALLALLADSLGTTIASITPFAPLAATAGLLAAVFGVHLVPRVAGGVQVVLTGTLALALVVLVVPGLAAVVPGNFDPLLPTPALRGDPVGSMWRATLAATFGFLGLEASIGIAGAVRRPRETLPNVLFGSIAAVGVLTTLTAFVVLGTIPWVRLVFAPVPLLDAAESYLNVSTGPVLTVGAPVATAGALVALVWVPSRLLAGMAEVLPTLAHENRFGAPDVALATVLGIVGAIVGADAVEYALYLAPIGFVVLYAAHALTTAALPFVRPTLYETCRLRPRPAVLVAAGVVGAGTMLALALWTLRLDPVATLALTNHGPALSILAPERLLRDPLRSVVPAILGWLTAGVMTTVVARDYRLSAGVEDEPLAAMYEDERSTSTADRVSR